MTYTQDIFTFGFGLLIFWLIVFLMGKFLHLKYYGVEAELGYITFRSSKFKALLYKISGKWRFLWKTISNLSIVFGVGLTIYATYFALNNLLKLIQPGVEGIPLLPVLPGLTIRLYWFPYLLLPISVGIITHEAAHGVIARHENISLKSAGVAFVLAFLGGFVETNEEEFERASTKSKLRVLSAGSFVNLVTFLVAMLIVSALFVNVPSGIVIREISEGSIIEKDGRLRQWDIIYDINGTLRNLSNDLDGSLRNAADFLANVTPGDTLILNTSKGILQMHIGDSTGEKSLGLSSLMRYYPSRLGLDPLCDVQLYLTLNLGVTVYGSMAIFNMLPLIPFDGDKFLFYMVKGLTTKRSREVRIVFNVIFFIVVAGNMILSFVKYGPS